MSINEIIVKYILIDEDIKYYFNLYCIKLYNKDYEYNLENCKTFLNDLFTVSIFKSSFNKCNMIAFVDKKDYMNNRFYINIDKGIFKNKSPLITYLELTINGKRNII